MECGTYVLGLLASAVALLSRRPALVHSLWLLVLIKLITPPIWQVEVFQLPKAPRAEAIAEAKDFPAQPVLDTSDFSALLGRCEPGKDSKH